MKRLIFVIAAVSILLVGCSSIISEEEAIEIASSQVPPDYQLQAKEQADAYFNARPYQNDVWTVYIYKLNITREELEQFGWQEGDNVSFGNATPGTNKYYGVLVYIDGKTGEIMSKATGLWLGPGPQVVSKGLTTGWIILIVVASLIPIAIIGWFLWRKMRVSK